MQTTSSIKAQIFIRMTVSILIVYGQGYIMNELEFFEQWICETFHSPLIDNVNNLL